MSRMTSHFDIPVDIPATIMPFLGVMTPAGEYSLENNFLKKQAVFSPWCALADSWVCQQGSHEELLEKSAKYQTRYLSNNKN